VIREDLKRIVNREDLKRIVNREDLRRFQKRQYLCVLLQLTPNRFLQTLENMQEGLLQPCPYLPSHAITGSTMTFLVRGQTNSSGGSACGPVTTEEAEACGDAIPAASLVPPEVVAT
jgi:hypothetical protein